MSETPSLPEPAPVAPAAAAAAPAAAALPPAPSLKLLTIFAVLPILINFLTNILSRAIGDTAPFEVQLGFLVFVLLTRLAIMGLIVAGVIFARRVLREAKTGQYRGRGSGIFALVWFGILTVGVLYFFISETIGLIQVL